MRRFRLGTLTFLLRLDDDDLMRAIDTAHGLRAAVQALPYVAEVVAAFGEVAITLRHARAEAQLTAFLADWELTLPQNPTLLQNSTPPQCPPPASPRFTERSPPAVSPSHAAPARSWTLDSTPSLHSLQTHYDGPDLLSVAETLDISVAELIARHSAHTYTVLAVGFQPGFAYLGVVPAGLRLPRRATPRTRVPAGSLAIAEDMTAVYPHASPGGWHLIGRCPEPLVDLHGPRLGRFAVGDQVRFVDCSRA